MAKIGAVKKEKIVAIFTNTDILFKKNCNIM